MKTVKPKMMEYQLEATFLHNIYFESGCRQPSFTPICGSGPNSAILHYGHAGKPNNRQIQDGELVLVDMGAEYDCYDGDLTSTIPANGKYTDKQKGVYETVLAANRAVIAAMKPGVDWKQMHALANTVICEGMKKLGLVKVFILFLQKNQSISKSTNKNCYIIIIGRHCRNAKGSHWSFVYATRFGTLPWIGHS